MRVSRHLISCVILLATASIVSGCVTANSRGIAEFEYVTSSVQKPYSHNIIYNKKDPNTPFIEKFEVRPGDCAGEDCNRDRERSELQQLTAKANPGTKMHYSMEVFFPESWVSNYPTLTTVVQFQNRAQNFAPPWMIKNLHKGLWLVGTNKPAEHQLITEKNLRGKWHKIDLFVRWNGDHTGIMDVHVNGEQKVHYVGNTSLGQSGIRLKYGIYRSWVSRYTKANGGDAPPTQIVKFRNVAVDKKVPSTMLEIDAKSTRPAGCSDPTFAKMFSGACG